MKHLIELVENQGIANRIFCLFSFLRIYKPKEFDIVWADKGWVSDKFFSLFDFSWDYEIKEFSTCPDMGNYFNKVSENWKYVEGWRLYVDKNDGVKKYFQKKYFNSPSGYSIDLEYNRIPRNVLDIYLPYFERLKPSSAVLKRLENVKKKDYVALQVRNNGDWKKREVSLKKYFKIIDKYPPNTKFYLSAMNLETQNIFVEKYPDRIIVLPDKQHNSMVDAVADLFLMSKANEFIVSYKSTFPALAWFLGGANARVTIAGEPKIKNFFSRIFKNFSIFLKTGFK